MSDYDNMDAFLLRRARYALLQESSNLEEELDRRREQDRHLMRVEERDWSEEGFAVKLTGPQGRGANLIGPELGFNTYNMTATMLEVPPGSEEGTYHSHGEAIKYYLQGEGIEIIGDKRYTIKAGDAVFVPADTWHGTQNNGTEPIRILAADHTLSPYRMKMVIQGSIDEEAAGPVHPETKTGRGEFPKGELGNLDAFQLYRRRRALMKERSKLEEELNRKRAQDRHVMRSEELEWTEEGFGLKLKGAQGRGATVIGPELGFNIHNLTATLLEVPPGSEEGTYHYHGEAVKYYVRGEATEIIGDKRYQVKAGDVVFVPANTWHGAQNNGTEPVLIYAVAHSLVPLVRQLILKSIDDPA